MGRGVGSVEGPVAVPIVGPVEDTINGRAHARLARAGRAGSDDLPVSQHHRSRGWAAPHLAAVGVDHLGALRHCQSVFQSAESPGVRLLGFTAVVEIATDILPTLGMAAPVSLNSRTLI